MGNSLLSMTDTSLFSFHASTLFCVVLCFYCLFSYPGLLELHYGGRVKKSETAKEWARETGLSVREVEQRIDAELFLNEYPSWELAAPHQSIILHEMFLHTAEQGQKEAERLICWGYQGSASEPDPGAGQSAMELVGYWTGLVPYGTQQKGKVIGDIISS